MIIFYSKMYFFIPLSFPQWHILISYMKWRERIIFFSVLAKHEVTLELSITSCLKSFPCACFNMTVFWWLRQNKGIPCQSIPKPHCVLESSTGFKTVMVKPWVIFKLHCTTRTNVIPSGCNQVPLQHCLLMHISAQKAKQANDINPNSIMETKIYGRENTYVKKKRLKKQQ